MSSMMHFVSAQVDGTHIVYSSLSQAIALTECVRNAFEQQQCV